MRALGWLAVTALLLSMVANVVGNVSLATMLTNATLESGYLGLALYAGAAVLAAITKLLFSRRESTRFNIVRQHTGPLLDSFGRLIKLVALLAWIITVLNEFRVFRPIKDALTAVLTHPIEIGEISITLGNIVLFNILEEHRRCNWGIKLDKKCWRQGYGTEAARLIIRYVFEDLGFNRLKSDTHAGNTASQKFQESLGFVKEGVFREERYVRGRYLDDICYGMVQEDYEAFYGGQ